MSSYLDSSESDLSDVDIACISLYSISLLGTFIVAVLSCVFARRFASFARSGGLAWLINAAAFVSLSFVLYIAYVVVRYYSTRDYYGDYDLYSSTLHLSAVQSLFSYIAYAMVLFMQFEIALGMHQLVSGKTSGMPISRIIALLLFVLVVILDIASFGVFEAYINVDYYDDSFYDLGRSAAVMYFVITLLLFLASLGVLIYTCLSPRVLETHRARILLIIVGSLSVIRCLYQLVLSGIYNLAPFTNAYVDYPEWLPALGTVFIPLTITIGLALAYVAATTTQTADASYGQTYTQQPYPQQPYSQQPYPQQAGHAYAPPAQS